MLARASEWRTNAAVARFSALSPLDDAAHAALELAIRRPRQFRSRGELLTNGQPIKDALLILSGWAARVHILADGRRQILNFLLPGDLVGRCDQDRPVASSTVVAITDVDTCVAPDAGDSPALARVYAKSRALDEAYLLAQITRLGRLNAHERLADLMLELFERMELAGCVADNGFVMPITQEVIADAVGLTSVHVNRMLQTLRRDGHVHWQNRRLALPDPTALRRISGRARVRVSAD